jgi:hypothetical protein
MPRIVYGLREVHPTHRIQNPEPARAWRHEMPEACTLCHINRTARWAAVEMARQYGRPAPEDLPGTAGAPAAQDPPATAAAGAMSPWTAAASPWNMAETIRALLSGDVVQRAVAAEALAAPAAYAEGGLARLWAAPFLILSLEDDYPGFRHMAARSLRRLVERAGRDDAAIAASLARLPEFDALADPPVRARAIAAWRDWWAGLDKRPIPHPGPAVPLDGALQPAASVVENLRAMQKNVVIAIGE